MEEVISFINSLNILEDELVVLACSYGPDSMCLLNILKSLNINVVVAHVNHKFRIESDQEYIDLKNYCDKNSIIFEGIEIKEDIVGNTEEYFRNFRYDYFKKIVNKYNSRYLFTAHHGDDLVETILMRLSRGSSFGGYAGFKNKLKVNNYEIVRPLIYITKEDIMKYVKLNNIPYAVDETNLESIYTRNRYRNQILPILKDINPKVHKKFIKFSYLINEYNDYLIKEVDTLYSNLYINNRLDLNDFNILPVLLKKELLRKILFNIYDNNISLINDKHLDLIFDLISNEKVNSFINLPNNIIVRKYYNILEFNSNKCVNNYDYVLEDKVIVNNISISMESNTNIIKSNYLIRLNSKDINLPIHVRNRYVGDKIILKNGTKKVGEVLSESKMPKMIRDSYPIVVDSNGKILWIPGIKKSKFDKQISEDYDIILKCVKKGEDYEE